MAVATPCLGDYVSPEHVSDKCLKCISLMNNNCIITEVRDFISETTEVQNWPFWSRILWGSQEVFIIYLIGAYIYNIFHCT